MSRMASTHKWQPMPQYGLGMTRSRCHVRRRCLVSCPACSVLCSSWRGLDVSLDTSGCVLALVFVGFQAMKASGRTWPVMTEEERERPSPHVVARVTFREDWGERLRDHARQQYLDDRPEHARRADVQGEPSNGLRWVVPEETNTDVMLAAATFVNGMAFIPMHAPPMTGGVAPTHSTSLPCRERLPCPGR